MEKTELVFIPYPEIGHLAAGIEIAKMITRRDRRLSIAILIIKLPFGSNHIPITSVSDSIRFVMLPPVELSPVTTGPAPVTTEFLKAQIPLVREAVNELTRSDSARLGGFVVDMFCAPMIDVADEFGLPSYLFFTSSAAFLGFKFHLQFLRDNKGLDFNEFKNSGAELEVPSFANPVPGRVFPTVMLDKEGGGTEMFLSHARRFRQVKGIMVNTFVELESHAIRSFSDATLPPVYPVGPILNTQAEPVAASPVMSWLDDQPPSSVIFLCFGSRGSFSEEQVKEIAHGLERSGHRFLWSLSHPPSPSKMGSPSDYANMEEVLPEGFLHRTANIGKVIGWAPQVAILAHPAVQGFVSHCGWNSTLESIWYGVPIATLPLYAEQQLNAFQLVKDLGLAAEIKMDYYMDSDYIVSAQEIEIGLKNLMNIDNNVRKKWEEMKKISRKVMIEGGSSHSSLGNFIGDMMTNIPYLMKEKKNVCMGGKCEQEIREIKEKMRNSWKERSAWEREKEIKNKIEKKIRDHMTMCVQEEKRLVMELSESAMLATTHGNNKRNDTFQICTSISNQKGKGRIPPQVGIKKENKCLFCKRKGHMNKDCPKFKKWFGKKGYAKPKEVSGK